MVMSTPATPQEAYLRLMAAALDAARDFTLAADQRQRTVNAFDGEVRMNRLADLFEGVTNELILAGNDDQAALRALERVREVAESSDGLAAWVESVLTRYDYTPSSVVG